MDLTLALSAVIFTLLALVVATSLFSGSSPAAEFASYFGGAGDGGATGGLDQPGPTRNGNLPDAKKKKKEEEKKVQQQKAQDDWCEISGSSHDHWDVVKSVLSSEGATESPEINDANESLRYAPGKARSHHLQRMMSKDELEEERRVQREQLAAIFQLLKENQETFGEVTDGDMEEQLRLYSI